MTTRSCVKEFTLRGKIEEHRSFYVLGETMTAKFLWFSVFAVAVSSCKSHEEILSPMPLPRDSYVLQIDRIGDEFFIRLRSISDVRLCVLADQWPTPGGWVSYPNSSFLSVGDGQSKFLMLETRITENDPKILELDRGGSLSARIHLKHFDFGEGGPTSDLQLNYSPMVYDCRDILN